MNICLESNEYLLFYCHVIGILILVIWILAWQLETKEYIESAPQASYYQTHWHWHVQYPSVRKSPNWTKVLIISLRNFLRDPIWLWRDVFFVAGEPNAVLYLAWSKNGWCCIAHPKMSPYHGLYKVPKKEEEKKKGRGRSIMLDLRWSLMPHVGISQLIGGVDPNNSRNRCRLPQRSWAAAGCGVRCAGGAQESCHHGMKSSTANTGTRPNVPVCCQKLGFGFGYPKLFCFQCYTSMPWMTWGTGYLDFGIDPFPGLPGLDFPRFPKIPAGQTWPQRRSFGAASAADMVFGCVGLGENQRRKWG